MLYRLILCVGLLSYLASETYAFQRQVRVNTGLHKNNAIPRKLSKEFRSSTPASHTMLKASVADFTSLMTAVSNENIATAFSFATFLPQPFWFLMILAPNWSVTRKLMTNVGPSLAFSLLHFFIVASSISQPDGTAPLAEFTGVFDPSGAPQQAMLGMMKYPNFVTEEWSHVLTWDLAMGQLIFIDGLRRGIFTPHSILLTNFIGPPGFLLHCITCLIQGKGLPNVADIPPPPLSDEDIAASALSGVPPPPQRQQQQQRQEGQQGQEWSSSTSLQSSSVDDSVESTSTSLSTSANSGSGSSGGGGRMAEELVRTVMADLYNPVTGVQNLVNLCEENVLWEDTTQSKDLTSKREVEELLRKRVQSAPRGTYLDIQRITDGGPASTSAGFTWQMAVKGYNGEKPGKGLRGTTYLEVNPATQKICYVREVVEPLYKPGDSTAVLLKAVSQAAMKKAAATATEKKDSTTTTTFVPRNPTTAADMVQYLWFEAQSGITEENDLSIVADVFAEDITYEDFNFATSFQGKKETMAFQEAFNFPGIRFNPDKVSEGISKVCFTWSVEIYGVEKQVRGISFYETNSNINTEESDKDASSKTLLTYVRDIPEPAFKPAPLLSIAAWLRPGLRRFRSVKED